MATAESTLLLHKPYGVLSQFTPEPGSRWRCLADLVPVTQVYAAGRLDADSEGLLLLTAEGRLQQRLTDPRFGHWRTYWVQVEGTATDKQLQQLRDGVLVQGRQTLPARAQRLRHDQIQHWPDRVPPIRERRSIPTDWLELSLREGRNRQVRRMTAAVGLPTLRLIRSAIDLMDGGLPLNLNGLAPGAWRPVSTEERLRLQALLSRPAQRRRA
ncbi:Ribosomal large subunit pseudouridine synthase E [Synechococcus sp. WH 8101]|uniref:pseudouridine synthase n=1 Tax=Synechococcus sp. WH 8101 TaxID=59932 RepID=UPI001023269A|nr:pseudouridine synthase [Synechococcus sp. WH 8101]QBE68428.1 Ribosomal large subunit pseudouridine synthase E [Synechococcus sp. WH 8101]